MILKYQTLDGAWRTLDGVTEAINHGYRDTADIWKLAIQYDGDDAQIHNAGLPVICERHKDMTPAEFKRDHNLQDPPPSDDGTVRLYLVLTVRGQRGHWTFPDMQEGFLMSDDGKTIDRLLA